MARIAPLLIELEFSARLASAQAPFPPDHRPLNPHALPPPMSLSTPLFLSSLATLDLPSARAAKLDLPASWARSIGDLVFNSWRERFGSWDHWPAQRQSDALEALALLETRLPGGLWLGHPSPASKLSWVGFPAPLLPRACLASCRISPAQAQSLALFALAPTLSARNATHRVAAGWLSLAAQFHGPISPVERAEGRPLWFQLAVENNAPSALLSAVLEGFGLGSVSLAQAILDKASGVSDLFDAVGQGRQSIAWSLMMDHCRQAWSLPNGALELQGVMLWNPIAWRLLKALPITPKPPDFEFLEHALRAHSALAPSVSRSLASHLPSAEPWQRSVIEPLLAEAEQAELHLSILNPPAPPSPISRPRL